MTLSPIALVLLGMVVVVAAVLVFRLHAFLALILAAFLVALLTPQQALYEQGLQAEGWIVEDAPDSQLAFTRELPDSELDTTWHLFRPEKAGLSTLSQGTLSLNSGETKSYTWQAAEGETEGVPEESASPQEGDILVPAEGVALAQTESQRGVGPRIAEGFGSTCGKIGILIAMASVIGKCLLESGSAERIVTTITDRFGERWTPVALALSSFIVAIPVYFDTVFYLMVPLAVATAARTGKNYLLYLLAIVAGGAIGHSLVPPTPGPMFVASELGVGIGPMFIGGSVIAVIGVTLAFPFMMWANRRWPISPNRVLEKLDAEDAVQQSTADAKKPAFSVAIIPIVLPVFLIGVATIVDAILAQSGEAPGWLTGLLPMISLLGDKNVALTIAAFVGLLILWMIQKQNADIPDAVQDALSGAGVIILITGAGGAFGQVLRETGIAYSVQQMAPASGSGVALLCLAFGLTAIVRFAQGSATVSMITSAGIVAPLAQTMTLPYHPVYLALAIGSGSKPFPWMNDSGFWIVGRMGGLTVAETLKTFSILLTIMGFICFAATLAGATLLPLN